MSAYLIANYTILDPHGYAAYVSAVGPTIQSHGGEILVAGPGSIPVEGTPGEVTVVLKFPSMEAVQGWYDSPEYQRIVNLRRDSTKGLMVFANAFALPE
jgi:uncharacterized protein (DUF1330 family)